MAALAFCLTACGNAESTGNSGAAHRRWFGKYGSVGFLLRKILLKLLWLIFKTDISRKTQRVQDAINELTVEKINTEVTLLPIAIGSWSQQINLMIAGGDALDLLPTFYYGSGTFDSMRSSNQLCR